jgi:hypothetical protein
MAFVRAARPAVVKGVDDLGFLAEVKAASPGTVTIGRLSIEPQDYGGEPEAAAAALVAAQLPQLLQHPYVDYWEGWNEPDPNLDRMDWYARFEAERVRQLAAHGLRAAVGGFSTGVPELDEFALFVPAIEAAQAHRGILTLHEYAAPDLTFLCGDPLPGYRPTPTAGRCCSAIAGSTATCWSRAGWSCPWSSPRRASTASWATGRGRRGWVGRTFKRSGYSRAGGQTGRRRFSISCNGWTTKRGRTTI